MSTAHATVDDGGVVRGPPESEGFQPGSRATAAAPAPAVGTTTTASHRWLCRVCQVECGEREVFREHCGSDEHFDGLQAFGLSPDLFLESIKQMIIRPSKSCISVTTASKQTPTTGL
nr:unnamed protein product [Digitaria exilis]